MLQAPPCARQALLQRGLRGLRVSPASGCAWSRRSHPAGRRICSAGKSVHRWEPHGIRRSSPKTKSALGGVIGADVIAKSAPDGYTLGVIVPGILIQGFLDDKSPFDVMRDLTPISCVVQNPKCIVVNADVPAATLKELIDLVRKDTPRNSPLLSATNPKNGRALPRKRVLSHSSNSAVTCSTTKLVADLR